MISANILRVNCFIELIQAVRDLAPAPSPGASSPCRSSQKHNAHGPETVKIHYPWHPQHGQILRVHRRAKFPRGEYIYCELPDGTIGGFPSWITDSTKSSTFTVGAPLTSAAALVELRELLDSLHSNSQRGKASLRQMPREGTNDTQEETGGDADEPVAL
jgi:hypothetical protein